MKLKEPFVYFEKASVDKDGNYTCRVSDKHGNTYTHTYVVDVGREPKFNYENLQIVDWGGDVKNVLSNCDSEAKPWANVSMTNFHFAYIFTTRLETKNRIFNLTYLNTF